MCDRWFGHLYETMGALGLLDNTLLIVTTDHGHSIGDRAYMGKRSYPSAPEVYDVPLYIRRPDGTGAGKQSDLFVQHTDIAAEILDSVGVEPPEPIDGAPFWKRVLEGGDPIRDHVTVGWGTAVTVINDKWWLNCKIDGTGAFLYDLTADAKLENNIADSYPEEVTRLYEIAVHDAGGSFPDYLEAVCANRADAPGCSALVARR